uniref:Uncharacterized protein n=1 Tax=Anguilla anguilla TaxID=7936 RepID=A0A0E9VPH4_ANGAN
MGHWPVVTRSLLETGKQSVLLCQGSGRVGHSC